MDQKPIVLYLRMKGMILDAIHDNLARTLGKVGKVGKDAVECSTVTKYDRSTQFSNRNEATPPEVSDVERSPVDDAILTALAEFPCPLPFLSARELSRRICFPRSTVHWHQHITQSFRFTVRHLRWVSYF
jgi:hypothetical protein